MTQPLPRTSDTAPATLQRILIVDDDAVQRMIVSEISRQISAQADTAASIEEACALLAAGDYECVVIDLSLGNHDGIEVIRHIVDTGKQPNIIVISGFDERIRDAAIRFGQSCGLPMLGHLSKPLNFRDLRALLLAPEATRSRAAGHNILPPVSVEDLERALDACEISLHYQPKISFATGDITGVEALARWRSPTFGNIAPAIFIPIVENSHLAGPFTRYVLRQAIQDAAVWQSYAPHISVAVNAPASVMTNLAFPDEVEQLLAEFALNPSSLIIELTETIAASDLTGIADVLTRLRIKGVQLSIDDFGTGYSSMLSLMEMPFGELKIDRSFIARCNTDPYALKIVRATLSLAHEFGMKTVAEGIETQEVSKLLSEAHCDLAQGYLFARPMPINDLTRVLGTQTLRHFTI